jgi:carboxypeptidase C (cathepsin A)
MTANTSANARAVSRFLVAGAMVAGLLAIATPSISSAQDAQPKAAEPAPGSTKQSGPVSGQQKQLDSAARSAATTVPVRQLPADSTTAHSVDLPGRTLKFTVTAGSIPLMADDGRVLAEMGYVSYHLDGADPLKRPVTFAFNGGPGSASAWVHIGGFGPWRIPIDGAAVSPSAPPVLLPNAETWLDFTDLVFIDPAGTGYSRISRTGSEASASPSGGNSGGGSGGGSRAQGGNAFFYSVNGDVDSVSEVIAKWLRKHNRLTSPKMLVGESYGGIRAPKVTHLLQTQYGVGMNALMLVSPVMDFGQFRGPRHRMHMFVNTLPTIAAAAREAKGQTFKSRDDQADVEAYARGEYVQDFMRGPRDNAAVDRMIKRVAGYSGLSEATVRQYGAKFDEFIYIREANRVSGKQASGYDTSVTGDDADPTAYFPRWDDPFSAALTAPVKSAMNDLYVKLGWKTELAYNLASGDVLRGWQWGNSTDGVESFTQLRAAMALDPKLHLLVTHGATDLRTPYFASVLLLEQLPVFVNNAPGRVKLQLYPGGHMHYSRDGSRKALRDDAKALIEAR